MPLSAAALPAEPRGGQRAPKSPLQPYGTPVTLPLRMSRRSGRGAGHAVCSAAEGVPPSRSHPGVPLSGIAGLTLLPFLLAADLLHLWR